MPFKAILENLVAKTPGATGAILLDWEGEAVADFSKVPDMDMPAIGAHKGIILNLARDAMLNLKQANGVKTIAISTERAGVAISTIKEGYYLVVTLEKTGPFGRAFFEIKKSIRDIEREMG
ncbi:MAG: roadblock/LC7 domain-containing protein [Deltaproteobacteria bacterium]|nr:roadblock/LC7 domain-containing protein [Deltaproteobacteria bacterium]